MRIVGFVHFLQKQLGEFYEKCLPESGRSFEPDGKHKELTDVASNYRHFWVMMDDDQEIVGTIAIKSLPYDPKYAEFMHRNACEVKHLYLLNEFQGKGLGEKMLSFALDQAKLFGYTWAYLDSNRERSAKAIELYEQFGFEEIPPYNENQNANIYMRKRL